MVADAEALKRVAGRAAVAEITPGMKVGLGTGSTVKYTIEAIAEADLDIIGVPTSVQTEELATRLGIRLATLAEQPVLDLTIDGADEIDPHLDLIKGLGGALVREQVVAMASARLVIVADGGKVVRRLGDRAPLPIEVVPFAVDSVQRWLVDRGLDANLRRRDGITYVTDNHNHILDAVITGLADPRGLDTELRKLPGVVGTGFFFDLAVKAYVDDQVITC